MAIKLLLFQFYAGFKIESVMNCIVYACTKIKRVAWRINKFRIRLVSFSNYDSLTEFYRNLIIILLHGGLFCICFTDIHLLNFI